MADERWLPVRGGEGAYEVSDQGRVRSLTRTVWQVNRWGRLMARVQHGRVLKLHLDGDGYVRVDLKGVRETQVHRLVATAFCDNPNDKPQVNHRNGVRHHNASSNLEWCTNAENHQHAYRELGRQPTRHPGKPTLLAKNNALMEFPGVPEAARFLGVGKTAVMNAARKNGRSCGWEVRYV